MMVIFTPPTSEHLKALQKFKEAFKESGEEMHGTCGLDSYSTVWDWFFVRPWVGKGHSPFILYDHYSDTVYAMARLTPVLTQGLIDSEGYNFGFCVHPRFRNLGHGRDIMRLCLEQARRMRMKEVLMSADIDNPASWHCMEANGGVRVKETDRTYTYRMEF